MVCCVTRMHPPFCANEMESNGMREMTYVKVIFAEMVVACTKLKLGVPHDDDCRVLCV